MHDNARVMRPCKRSHAYCTRTLGQTWTFTYTHTYIFKGCRPCRRPRKKHQEVCDATFFFGSSFFFCVDQIQQYGHQLWWRWLFGCHLTQLSGTQFFQTHKTLSHTILDGISHMFG